MDLAIRGGTIVTEDGRGLADVGIADEKIALVGGHVPEAPTEIDASGLLVLPGGIDPHVHLTPSPNRTARWVDDFASGSRAAAAGGVTTIGNMTSAGAQESLLDAVDRIAREAEADSIVDVMLHPVIRDPVREHAILPELVAAGLGGVKVFMQAPEFEPNIAAFLAVIERAHALGLVVMLHCEDASINAYATERTLRSGRRDSRDYAASRPRAGEVAAVARAIAMLEVTGAAGYLVHVAGADALDLVARARARGVDIHAETRPLYLHCTDEVLTRPDAALYAGSPPVGSLRDQQALWDGLRAGVVATVASDHAPWRRDDKLEPTLTVRDIPPGLPELETSLPLLYSEGVGRGRLSLERFVQLTATTPSRIFGLYPRKGTIQEESDADLALWDPSVRWIIRATDGQSRSDYSPYEGRVVTGRPVTTIRRGAVIWSLNAAAPSPGHGRRLSSQPRALKDADADKG